MKKIVIIAAFFAVFILIGMGFTSALNTVQSNDKKSVAKGLDKLDSPLFQIRTYNAINADNDT